MALYTSRKQGKKVKVTFANGLLFIEPEGSKQQVFPLEWFPALKDATEEELSDWSQTEKGIHFNKLNTDVDLM